MPVENDFSFGNLQLNSAVENTSPTVDIKAHFKWCYYKTMSVSCSDHTIQYHL